MGRACRDDLPDGHSGIFLQKGLDHPNQPERIREISFYAQPIWRAVRPQAASLPRVFGDAACVETLCNRFLTAAVSRTRRSAPSAVRCRSGTRRHRAR
jgi:hypothetical protein